MLNFKLFNALNVLRKKSIIMAIFTVYLKLSATYVCILSCMYSKAQSNLATKDTLNRVDHDGKKQGYWIVLGKDRPGECYRPDQKVEEGRYENHRKTGVWTEYYCNGKIKSSFTFIDGRTKGFQKLFYENGQLKEEGMWSNGWRDKHKKYTEDGKVIEEPVISSASKKDTTVLSKHH